MTSKRKQTDSDWPHACDDVTHSIFRVRAGGLLGTGFVVSVLPTTAGDRWFRAILVSARHVLKEAEDGSVDVTLESADGTRTFATSSGDRMFMELSYLGPPEYDIGCMLLESDHEILPLHQLRPLYPIEDLAGPGTEVGWLGYPGIGSGQLCFFHGYVSAVGGTPQTYLIDGTAVHGASGSPVFDKRGQIVGILSAYIPNRRPGGLVLPGLSSVVPINSVRFFMEEVLGAQVRRPE
jgi:Trypsin-like peptidase domain